MIIGINGNTYEIGIDMVGQYMKISVIGKA